MNEIEKELQKILNAANVLKGYFQAKKALIKKAPLINYGKKILKKTLHFMNLSKNGFQMKKKEMHFG